MHVDLCFQAQRHADCIEGCQCRHSQHHDQHAQVRPAAQRLYLSKCPTKVPGRKLNSTAMSIRILCCQDWQSHCARTRACTLQSHAVVRGVCMCMCIARCCHSSTGNNGRHNVMRGMVNLRRGRSLCCSGMCLHTPWMTLGASAGGLRAFWAAAAAGRACSTSGHSICPAGSVRIRRREHKICSMHVMSYPGHIKKDDTWAVCLHACSSSLISNVSCALLMQSPSEGIRPLLICATAALPGWLPHI